jgi:diguanylate cyclase (GGDEF)-like protein
VSAQQYPLRLKVYIGAVLAATFPLLTLAVARITSAPPDADTLLGVGVFLTLAFFADLKPVPLDEKGDRPISLAFMFILASEILFGWEYAVLTAALSVFVPQLIERRPPSRMLFNTGAYVLATVASAFPGIFITVDGNSSALPIAAWTFLGGAVFALVNFMLVCLAIVFLTSTRFRPLFVDNVRHGGPAFVTMAFFAALAVVLWHVDPPVLVLLAGPLAALTLYQRSALASKIARRDAHTDSLTGLGNHRAYELMLAELLERAENDGTPLVLVYADIDDFKSINDTFGHPVGDAVLQQLGSIFDDRGGAAFRFGGDEFALTYTLTADEIAAELEALLDTVATTQFDGVGRIGISLGACAHVGGMEASDLERRTDAALYGSKHQGKHRWCLYDPALVREPTEEDVVRSADRRARLQAAEHLIRVVDARDPYTARHSQSVSTLAHRIALELGLGDQVAEQVRLAGLLHDLGKVAIPDSILTKPGPLDEAERELVRAHPELGYAILDGLDLSPVDTWVLHHHEHWDGSGYPHGLIGHDIPIGSRIILVADAFDTIVTGRHYRAARDTAEALAELRHTAGRQFDEDIVRALERALGLSGHIGLKWRDARAAASSPDASGLVA